MEGAAFPKVPEVEAKQIQKSQAIQQEGVKTEARKLAMEGSRQGPFEVSMT